MENPNALQLKDILKQLKEVESTLEELGTNLENRDPAGKQHFILLRAKIRQEIELLKEEIAAKN